MINLDNKDRAILIELDKDARKSASQIGKLVKLSQDVVNYRIKRLEEAKVIKRYISIIQFFKLNYSLIKICVQFQHLPKETLQEIIDFLKSQNEVMWIVECNGRWDLIVTFSVGNLGVFENAKNAFLEKYGNFIAQKSIAFVIGYRASPRTYLLPAPQTATQSLKVDFEMAQGRELDKTDLEIVNTLSRNSRLPIVTLAKKVHTTPRMADYRLKKLKESGVIVGTRISIDLEKIGYKFFKSFIYLENAPKKRKDALLNFCDEHPNIITSVNTIGDWDFEAEFEVQSNEEFYEILKYMRNNFSDIIKTIETVLISKEHELHYF